MKTAVFVSLGVVSVSTALWFVAGSRHTQVNDTESTGHPARAVLYYRDPMHPSYTSNKPGKAPDCGMELQPVYAEEVRPTRSTLPSMPNAVQVSRERQQMIGVQLGRVERSRMTQTLRTFGRVVVDENRLFPVMAGGDGWVTKTLPGTATGDTVRKGQSLAIIYGRDYTTAQRTFLYALRTSENPPPAAAGDVQDQTALTLQDARLSLQNLGFGQAHIEQLAKTRQVMPEITLTAPASGVIVARNAFPNQKVNQGAELFRISDLTHVWIVADLFGDDEVNLRRGVAAVVSVPNRSTAALRATVTEALPRFDEGSRTLKLRLEAENPHLILRPDMLVDLEFPITLPEATTVPADAVIESGLRKTVFVHRGEGVFEPRTVETGWRSGGRVQIIRGLNPGESIVVAGNFLLDSESRMRRGTPGGHD